MSKRKAEAYRRYKRAHEESSRPTEPDPSLFIQAHEADVIRGPRGHAAALALEVRIVDGQEVAGEGLMRLGGLIEAALDENGDELEMKSVEQDADAVWVDRYDARLLLDAWQAPSSASAPDRMSPTGWSDLPSDTEDMFFLSPDEIEDYHRVKRRRMIEQGREDRLRAMREEEGEDQVKEEEEWGGSDEEPDESQRELMRRTALHILSSPNSAQLEMRILANHGADKRFAFLRGRWSRAWKIAKSRIRIEQEEEKRKKEDEEKKSAALGGLTGYGDSDDESEAGEGRPDVGVDPDLDKAREPLVTSTHNEEPQSSSAAQEDVIKEARRARAREWAEKRRAQTKCKSSKNLCACQHTDNVFLGTEIS